MVWQFLWGEEQKTKHPSDKSQPFLTGLKVPKIAPFSLVGKGWGEFHPHQGGRTRFIEPEGLGRKDRCAHIIYSMFLLKDSAV